MAEAMLCRACCGTGISGIMASTSAKVGPEVVASGDNDEVCMDIGCLVMTEVYNKQNNENASIRKPGLP
jgi:predicted RNA methylase